MLSLARAGLSRLTPQEAADVADAGGTIVDVRTGEQIARDGRLPGALEISLNVLEWRLDPSSSSRHRDAPGLDDPVVLVCNQGYSSSLAASRLQSLGFTRATDVIGGFEAWRDAGLPVDSREAEVGR